MNTSTKTVEVRALASVADNSARPFERMRLHLMTLIAPFGLLTSKAASKKEPKDQSYADYLETMAVLTGF